MAASDPFTDGYVGVPSSAPLRRGIGAGLYITSAGLLDFTTQGGTRLSFEVVAGQLVPFRVSQLNQGTTAGVIVGTHR